MTQLKYPVPYLNALPDGCVMDLRVRLAAEILKTPGYLRHFDLISPGHAPRDIASGALDIAEALYAEAEKRQLIEDLPNHADLTKDELNHIRRQAAGNVIGQLHAQEVARKEQGSTVMTAPPGMFRG